MINHELLKEVRAIATILVGAQANIDHVLDQPQDLACTEKIVKSQLLQARERLDLLVKLLDF
jgi:hypothetical protein